MNYAIVFRLLGYVLMIEGALLLLPAAASGFYGEWFVLGVFLITAAVSAAIGYARCRFSQTDAADTAHSRGSGRWGCRAAP